MSIPEQEDADDGLPPPGRRWGAGAHSVLPYLTKSLQAKPAPAPEPAREGRQRERERNPAFDGRPSARA